jgi:hypothetical protein
MPTRRVHTDILIQVAEDLALENILGQFSEEQDQDGLIQVSGPFDIEVAASVTDQQFIFPTGVTNLRFIAIMKVTVSTGIQITLDSAANDPFLVAPPTGTSLEGQLVMTTNATALYFDNPSSTTAVGFTALLGFANS